MSQVQNIQWFPGHMTKTKRRIQANLKLVDAVAEIIDARIPVSSRNPDLDSIIQNKPRIILMNKCDMAEVLRDIPADKLAMGNLDPVTVFKQGTVEEMKQAVTELLERCAKYPNFVLSSGCDTPPNTPLANIDAFFEALQEFNDRKNADIQ